MSTSAALTSIQALSPADWEAATAACKARNRRDRTSGACARAEEENSNSRGKDTIRQLGLLDVEVEPADEAGTPHGRRWRCSGATRNTE